MNTMGATSGSASTAIWLLMNCVTALAPTGVAAQAQVDTVPVESAAVTVNTSAEPSLVSIAIAPDIAAESQCADAAPDAEPAHRGAGAGHRGRKLADRGGLAAATHAGAAEVSTQHRLASETARLLRRNDVALFRTAFVVLSADDPAVDDLRRAALGDAEAAFKLAQQPQLQDAASRRRVGWLQYAALLGNDRAAYALSLHYRRESQPLMAAQFEARALALGYQPPAALDNARK